MPDPVRPLRCIAVVAGAGLIGWAIDGTSGLVVGLGAGLVVLGFTLWIGARIDALNDKLDRISLDEDDFGRLVRGQVVGRPGVQIALRDIGWGAMLEAIQRAHPDATASRRVSE